MVLLWHGGLLHLHHHPARPARGLCPFLEPVLAGEGGERKRQVLVCRYFTKAASESRPRLMDRLSRVETCPLPVCFLSSVVVHRRPVRRGFRCRRALLRVLYPAQQLHGAQGLHQPQLNILPHCVHCGHSSQSPGNVDER